MNAKRKKSVGMNKFWKLIGLIAMIAVVGWGTAVSARAAGSKMTEADLKKWRDASKPVWVAMSSRIGKDLLKKVEDEVGVK